MARQQTKNTKKITKKIVVESSDSDSEYSADSELNEIEDDIDDYESNNSDEYESDISEDNNIKIYIKSDVKSDVKPEVRRSVRLSSNKRKLDPDSELKSEDDDSDDLSEADEIIFKNRKSKRLKIMKKSKSAEESEKESEEESEKESAEENNLEDDDSEPESAAKSAFIESILSKIMNNPDEEVNSKKTNSRIIKWKTNLSKRDILNLEPEFNKIYKEINKMPTIKELLETPIPFNAKCNLVEKLLILDNIQIDTFEHLNLKRTINEEIRKYSKSDIKKDVYDKYAEIENKINSSNYAHDIPLKYKILGSGMPFNNKIAIFNKFKHLETISDSSGEYSKLEKWIETAMNVPYNIKNLPISISDGNKSINEFLYNVKIKLDEKIYGLDGVKNNILFILNNMITNPDSRGLGMALVGPQGVGKTEIANAIAEAINIPFVSIPLGGSNDGSFLSGHSYTYEGSIPGAIVSSLIKMQQLNGIILFDELDKISNTPHGSEISKLLLHITDSTQNHDFKDKYLGNDISINLSNIWFIYSLNYINALDKTLRDRIPIVAVDGYTKNEKKEIAKRHLIPNALKNIGINPADIVFTDETLSYLVEKSDDLYVSETKSSTGKSGVRQLKHIIYNTIMKLNMIKNCILEDGTFGNLNLSYNIEDFKLPFTVNKNHIDKLNVLPVVENKIYSPMYM